MTAPVIPIRLPGGGAAFVRSDVAAALGVVPGQVVGQALLDTVRLHEHRAYVAERREQPA